ncbi:Zn-ribbon domain-containing OB-fold protein [Streptomyces macrosporus]|uniref:DUF35 domain-containing protein n=1 Tax=Streptomyces macrosporus TaxID=44032 RepID=A0ABN3KJ51_9ACTN
MVVSTVIDVREDDAAVVDGGHVPAPSPTPSDTGGDLREPHHDGLYYQRCRWCRTPVFRRLLCPVCASTDFDREAGGGTGVVRRVISVDRSAGTPCTVALITMDEGYQVRSTVTGTPPQGVHTGARVRLAPETAHGHRKPVFRLCEDPYADHLPAAWR